MGPTKTITTTYSQGNIAVFGSTNAVRQYVAMSLSALIFNFRKTITSSGPFSSHEYRESVVLRSILSKSIKDMFLLLTDLLAMVELFGTYYELRYSKIKVIVVS